MKVITFQVPDYIDTPGTIADYAFAHAMQSKYGDLYECAYKLANRDDLLEEHPDGQELLDRMNEAASEVTTYVNAHLPDYTINDPVDEVVRYVQSFDEDGRPHPTWLHYIQEQLDYRH